MKLLLLMLAIGASYLGRHKLVHLLTKTTGTWVGTPRDERT